MVAAVRAQDGVALQLAGDCVATFIGDKGIWQVTVDQGFQTPFMSKLYNSISTASPTGELDARLVIPYSQIQDIVGDNAVLELTSDGRYSGMPFPGFPKDTSGDFEQGIRDGRTAQQRGRSTEVVDGLRTQGIRHNLPAFSTASVQQAFRLGTDDDNTEVTIPATPPATAQEQTLAVVIDGMGGHAQGGQTQRGIVGNITYFVGQYTQAHSQDLTVRYGQVLPFDPEGPLPDQQALLHRTAQGIMGQVQHGRVKVTHSGTGDATALLFAGPTEQLLALEKVLNLAGIGTHFDPPEQTGTGHPELRIRTRDTARVEALLPPFAASTGPEALGGIGSVAAPTVESPLPGQAAVQPGHPGVVAPVSLTPGSPVKPPPMAVVTVHGQTVDLQLPGGIQAIFTGPGFVDSASPNFSADYLSRVGITTEQMQKAVRTALGSGQPVMFPIAAGAITFGQEGRGPAAVTLPVQAKDR